MLNVQQTTNQGEGGNNFYDTKQRRQRKIGSGATKQGGSFTQRSKAGKGAKRNVIGS